MFSKSLEGGENFGHQLRGHLHVHPVQVEFSIVF